MVVVVVVVAVDGAGEKHIQAKRHASPLRRLTRDAHHASDASLLNILSVHQHAQDQPITNSAKNRDTKPLRLFESRRAPTRPINVPDEPSPPTNNNIASPKTKKQRQKSEHCIAPPRKPCAETRRPHRGKQGLPRGRGPQQSPAEDHPEEEDQGNRPGGRALDLHQQAGNQHQSHAIV